jgi:hypothetical protein
MSDIPQASAAPKATEFNADDIVDGRYRILRHLGQGGMGTVYEAQQVNLRSKVALKVLLPQYAKNATFAKRFEREADAMSSIDHRNVVKILSFGNLPTGELFYTMELLQGQDLAQLLRDSGALPWSRAGWIILQVVRAFAAIHEKGIIHRDLKPANCFMLAPKAGDEPDFVKILDFGIANRQDEDGKEAALTGTSDILGTGLYMSPEQAASEPVDSRTDIYCLGIMMYELLTGDVPFRDKNIFNVLRAHKEKAPRRPRELKPDIPPEVENIIMSALSKSPKDRPQAMADIEAALVPLVDIPGTIEGSRTAPRAGSSSIKFRDTYAMKRRRQRLGMVVAAVAMFVVALAVTRWLKNRPAERDRVIVVPPDEPPQQVVVADSEPEWLLLLPEKQYDPFADPFGHASLAGLMVPSPDGIGLVPLETLLPREPWTLPPERVTGRILNDRKRPLVDASVCVWMVDPTAPAEHRRRPICTQTDRRGRFDLKEVVPGYYDVIVSAHGFLPQSYFQVNGYPLTVQPEKTSEGIEMTLEAGGVEVRGIVKSKLGDRLEQAKVAVVGPVRTLVTTNEAGEFSLWVAEGELSLVAWAENYADAVDRGVSDQKFSFSLSRESVLVGKVVDSKTDEPIQGARVRATPRAKGLDPLVYTNSKGEFRIPGLLAGEYEPSARTDDGYGSTRKTADAYRMAHNVIKVREGAMSSEVEIRLLRTKKVAIVAKEDDPPPTSAKRPDGPPGGSGSTVAGGFESTVAGGPESTVAGGPESTVAGGPESTVAGGPESTVAGGPESTVAGGSGSTVAGGTEPPAAGGTEPPAAGGTEPSAAGGTEPPAAGGIEPPVAGGTTTQKQVAPSKPKPNDRTRRKKLETQLKSCGKDGTITVTVGFVDKDGRLAKLDVQVTGEAAKDPKVKTCAVEKAESIRFSPRDEVDATFRPIVVKLDP